MFVVFAAAISLGKSETTNIIAPFIDMFNFKHLAIHKVQMHGAISKLLYFFFPVWLIIHSKACGLSSQTKALTIQ